MDAEWDDYEWQLQQYEKQKQQQQVGSSVIAGAANNELVQTLAIDLGSLFTKVAVRVQVPSNDNILKQEIELLTNRQGDRYFFNGVIYEQQEQIAKQGGNFFDDIFSNRDDDFSPRWTARQAQERFYYPRRQDSTSSTTPTTSAFSASDPVTTLPWNVLQEEELADRDSRDLYRAQRVLYDAVAPFRKEALERLKQEYHNTSTGTGTGTGTGTSNSKSSSKNSKSSDEESDHYMAKKVQVRNVITVPVTFLRSEFYQSAFEGVLASSDRNNNKTTTVFLPEPVAAIWGAQTMSLLPEEHQHSEENVNVNVDIAIDNNSHQPRTYAVVDVGSFETQLSIVYKDVVVASAALPGLGGETFVREAVELLLKDAPTSADGSPQQLNDARSLAALQVQGRAAVAELGSLSRVSVHVPYLFPDPANHHLDTTLSRPVLNQAVEASIFRPRPQQEQEQEQRDDQDQDDSSSMSVVDFARREQYLSHHIPDPTDLVSLWTSILTQLLERASTLPLEVDHVLLVGGGSKSVLVVESLQQALFILMGADASSKLAIPDATLRTDLTAIGATNMLSGYAYRADVGLERIISS